MSVPVYQRIKDVLTEEIRQGKYKPGDILPSVNELAKMFSTSRNTSVKAINDLSHEGIIYCVQGKGSVVNDLRKNNKKLAYKKVKASSNSSFPVIGVLLADFDDMTHPYLSMILRGISGKAKTMPCNLKTFCIKNYSIDDFIRTEHFDGLIVLTGLPQTSVFLLKQNGIPFVLANNDIYGEELFSVTVDSFSATYKAVEYLHSLGHSKISVLSGPYFARSTPLAYSAYKHAMNHFKLNIDDNFFRSCNYGEEGGYAVFSEMLNSGKVPTAVFALEDFIAVGAMKAAAEKSLAIPRDLSVIGSGNMLNGSNVKVPLTTFNTKLDELGGLCLDMIVRQIKNEPIKNSKISLEPELIVRDSCKALRGSAKVRECESAKVLKRVKGN